MKAIHSACRLTLLSLTFWLLALSSTPAMATGTYYVSPTGSDANTGGFNDPFLTITKAQSALRTAGGGTVYLRGGTYTLTSTVTFDQRDSNSTYAAYPGEIPIISGGVVLTNWSLYSGDIYQASVTWNFRGLFKDGARLNYKNPVTYAYPAQYAANVTFTDSAGPTNLAAAGDWALDHPNGLVYYKTGGGVPAGTIVAGSLQTLFQVEGTETAKVSNLTFDHLYFFYNNWVSPSTTYTDSWGGNFVDPLDSTKIGEIPGAVAVEFATGVTISSCRVAHNASDGISFGRGVTNSQVVGNEVYDNGGNGILFGYMGNTTGDGYRVYRDPNGQTLTYIWYGDANWIEDSDVVTDNYVHDNDQTYPTTVNIRVSSISNVQVNYNRTDNSQYSSIIGDTLYGASYKADYNHISHTNTNSSLPDGGGIYSVSGQNSPNVGITGEYIGNLLHETHGLGPLYIDGPQTGTAGDQFTVNNNVTYNVYYAPPANNPLANHNNNATLSGNNTTPTQAQIDAAAASTGPRPPYKNDLFNTTLTFEDRPDAATALTGVYTGIDWGSQLWSTSGYQGNHYLWINSSSTAQVTQTFTLPAGTVLKSLEIWGTGATTVSVSSTGNQTQTYNVPGTLTLFTTGWTTASATVTIQVTCANGAYGVSFKNLVYGNPPDTTVTFADRPSSATALTGVYAGIDWGSQLWTTDVYLGVHELWINSTSTAQVTQTFTLPAGAVLKSLQIEGPVGATVIVQSTGNADQTYSVPASWATFTTGWTTAAATVTIKVTSATYGANTVGFTNLVYGNP